MSGLFAWEAFLRRLTTRRYRGVLIALAATLAIGGTLLSLNGLARWQRHHALYSDTATVVSQAREQLVRSLVSRRGTLTFIRDVLNRQPDLSRAQLAAFGASASEHTRHLLGTGIIRDGEDPAWWYGPHQTDSRELARLEAAVIQRSRLRGVWGVPSTLVVWVSDDRPMLIMLEPLKAVPYRRSGIVGVFDLKPLLGDFFTSGLAQHLPTTVLDGETILYRSEDWRTDEADAQPIEVERPIRIDAVRWTVQMQPGKTGLIQALSWVSILLIALSVITGVAVIFIVWILVARTWILQRIVARRTAALRRTLGRVRQLAITDELTGLYNRRFFLNRWNLEFDRSKRYGRPLACLMIDVNGFKQVNDRLGHHAGDELLKRVSAVLLRQLRQTDVLARFGGDEFIVALPETTVEQAETVAAKLRQVAIPPLKSSAGLPPIRLSVGLAWNQREEWTSQDILNAADASLYEAKRDVYRKRSRAESVRAST